ncbi:MAG: 5-formyltetrahydrofolate cyclo-ligase [Limisphaerales bacterium]
MKDPLQQAKKNEWRVKIRAIVKSLSLEKRQSDSEKLRAAMSADPLFQAARSILFFASIPEEPDLWPLISHALIEKKMVALPCFDADNQSYRPRRVSDLHVEILSGKFGIREPLETCVAIPVNDLDLVLVPGVAFGMDGHRLGRGKGYYDRLLQQFTGKKMGIAFDEQIVEIVPSAPNDVKMDVILTPTRCLKFNQ